MHNEMSGVKDFLKMGTFLFAVWVNFLFWSDWDSGEWNIWDWPFETAWDAWIVQFGSCQGSSLDEFDALREKGNVFVYCSTSVLFDT